MRPFCGVITWQILKSEEDRSTWHYLQDVNEAFTFFANISFNDLWKETEADSENAVGRTIEMILHSVYGVEVESMEMQVNFPSLRQELERLMQRKQLALNELLESLGVFSMTAISDDILKAGDTLQEFFPREHFTDYIPDLGYGPPKGYRDAPQYLAEVRRREKAKARAKSRKRRKRRSGLKRARYQARKSNVR